MIASVHSFFADQLSLGLGFAPQSALSRPAGGVARDVGGVPKGKGGSGKGVENIQLHRRQQGALASRAYLARTMGGGGGSDADSIQSATIAGLSLVGRAGAAGGVPGAAYQNLDEDNDFEGEEEGSSPFVDALFLQREQEQRHDVGAGAGADSGEATAKASVAELSLAALNITDIDKDAGSGSGSAGVSEAKSGEAPAR